MGRLKMIQMRSFGDRHRTTSTGLIAAFVAALALHGCSASVDSPHEQTLRVLSFNAWGAGLNDGRPFEDTLAVLRRADADLVGLQEMRAEGAVCEAEDCDAIGPSVAPAIAEALSYHLFEPEASNDALWASAILSRFPIVAVTPNELGVVVDTGAMHIALFNVHFTDYPYQPYQLTGIPYSDAPFLDDAQSAIDAANAARGDAVTLLLGEIEATAPVDVAFVTGDFNEPSLYDWTPSAASIGRHPIPVAWPATQRLEAAGFVDAYRHAWPDEVAKPGFTWTPSVAADAPNEHHDRIDFVFVRGENAKIVDASIIGESSQAAEIVIAPWPSDHRAVLAEVVVEPSR